MATIGIANDMIRVGPRFAVTFHRTLVVPDDGHSYPLPPGLGTFPIFSVSEYRDRVPSAWRQGTAFIPMHPSEALWIGFHGAVWNPNAVQVAIGHINAVTGELKSTPLRDDPQNYLVTPMQPWLDGINTGSGIIRQFRAVSLGSGDSIEAALTGEDRYGGIQINVFEPREGVFPDEPPQPSDSASPVRSLGLGTPTSAMGLGAGGEMQQRLYPDPYGLDVWDQESRQGIAIFLASPDAFRVITGYDAPPTPIDAQTYTDFGLPWFSLYDEDRADLPGSERLAGVPSIRERTSPGQPDPSISIPDDQVQGIEPESPGPLRHRDEESH